MMKIIKFITTLTFTLLLTTNVFARDIPLYMGVDHFRMEDKAAPDKLAGFTLRLGLDLNKYIGIEGYASRSSGITTTYTVSGNTADDFNYKVNYSSGVVLRGNLRFNRNRVALYAFGGVGYANADITSESASIKAEINETNPVYGIGVDLYGTRQTALTFTAGTYIDKKVNGVDTKITSYSLGITYYFSEPEFRKRY